MTEFAVGPGIAQAMAERNDRAASNELSMAWATGTSGSVYVYRSDTDVTTVIPGPGILPVPPVGELPWEQDVVLGLDVSNHQGDLFDEFARYPEHEHVVLRIPLSVEFPGLGPIAKRQADQILGAGKSLGGYVWGYRSVDPRLTVREAIAFFTSMGLQMPILWLDLETYHGSSFDPGPDEQWILKAVKECEARGQRVGLYTGFWWVNSFYPGGLEAFATWNHLPLWLADYDHSPDILDWKPFSGFQKLHGKQYSGSPVDLNVFHRSVTK